MIEFKGVLSEKTSKFLSRKTIQTGVFVMSITFGIVLIFILYLCFLVDYWYIFLGYVFVYMVTTFAGCLIWKSSKTQKKCTPKKIIINEHEIICYTANNTIIQSFDDLKQVIDYGDWYFLDFVTGRKSIEFICQKDLICNGTLEDFEEMFKNKMVRKN